MTRPTAWFAVVAVLVTAAAVVWLRHSGGPKGRQADPLATLPQCTSHMKQLCLAALMYTQDNGQKLPTAAWPDQLAKYVRNPRFYACPGAPEQTIGYALNAAVAGAELTSVKAPAETILFFEADVAQKPASGGADLLTSGARHGGEVVVGFVDGHVTTMPQEDAKRLLR